MGSDGDDGPGVVRYCSSVKSATITLTHPCYAAGIVLNALCILIHWLVLLEKKVVRRKELSSMGESKLMWIIYESKECKESGGVGVGMLSERKQLDEQE